MSDGNPEIMGCVENKTFDGIRPLDGTSRRRTLTKSDIELFAVMSGNVSPNHLDEEF